MARETTELNGATEVVRACLRPGVRVTGARQLHGGMVNRVEAWRLEGEGAPAEVVVKISPHLEDARFRHEYESLRYYREHTPFPVPQPHGCVSGIGGFSGTVLMMERLPGNHLGSARLTEEGHADVQRQMARHVADLHARRGEGYGSAVEGERLTRWREWFGPRLQHNYEQAAKDLSPSARQSCERVLEALPEWLPEAGEPTLVHSDLWATNVMVDDADPERPRVTGYVDPSALFTDVEYELAYLLVFATADDTFFDEYQRHHALRPGFERRCLVYWLNTLLLHVWRFGREYVPRTERIARAIDAAK